ncbi:MAG: hypothetical protein A2V65_02675 [Deltaproteobacteria bacterium RBG_13_49_15]|nr:MAG: hypothetical protein A2V65_02675 [Deltaproteobacteria bacterium RBG_13_49_15]
MIIRVQLFLHLRKFAPGEDATFDMAVEQGTTVDHIVKRLGIPPEMELLISINGRHADLDSPLLEGDAITFLVPIAGG